MHKFLFVIQTLIIIGLLTVVGVLGVQVIERNKGTSGKTETKKLTNSKESTTASTSATITTNPSENKIPDFTTANNKIDNPQQVQDAIAIIREYQPTGYRVSKDNKYLLYMNADHMVLMDIETKTEKELLSFRNWKRNPRAIGTECAPGSAFVDPMFNASEDTVFFGGPSEGKDALYMFPLTGKEAKKIVTVENCISDIAVSPDGTRLVYQTTKDFGTGSGYVTDMFMVKTDGTENSELAKAGKLPQESLVTPDYPYDFAPAQVVWTSEEVFYLQGVLMGNYTGIWKYNIPTKAFEVVTNLKGGP